MLCSFAVEAMNNLVTKMRFFCGFHAFRYRSVLRLVCYHCEGVLGHEKHTFGGEVRVVLSELDFSSFKEVTPALH